MSPERLHSLADSKLHCNLYASPVDVERIDKLIQKYWMYNGNKSQSTCLCPFKRSPEMLHPPVHPVQYAHGFVRKYRKRRKKGLKHNNKCCIRLLRNSYSCCFTILQGPRPLSVRLFIQSDTLNFELNSAFIEKKVRYFSLWSTKRVHFITCMIYLKCSLARQWGLQCNRWFWCNL